MKPTSNTGKHAELEIEVLTKDNPDCPISGMEKEIVALADAFGHSGQSGMSAPYTAEFLSMIVKQLCLQNPISPIMGDEDEWEKVSGYDTELWQNKRCSTLFKKSKDDKPKYIDAIVFVSEEGKFTGEVDKIYSSQLVKSFPFIPKTFYIDVITEEVKIILEDDRNFYERKDGTRYKHKIADWDQLVPVFEYYEQFKLENK